MNTSTRIALVATTSIAALVMCLDLARSQTAAEPFLRIAAVLQSPRCMNCHPAGDAPLQTDASIPHKQNVKRIFADLGGSCQTCHQAASPQAANLPPSAPHWHMPPADMPMVFEDKAPAELCADLLDATKNGGRSADDLVQHVDHDPLVLWAFDPGGGRTPPPMTHAEFVDLVAAWVALGAPCPN